MLSFGRGLITFVILAYVVLDGFDLGVGILFPFVKEEALRDDMMNSVAPVWDGNETWLVLEAALVRRVSAGYAVIMPALYAPIVGMLLALIFRGVAFEFRWKTRRGRFFGIGPSPGDRRSPPSARASRSARWSTGSRLRIERIRGGGGIG